jgi:hypothetical protein
VRGREGRRDESRAGKGRGGKGRGGEETEVWEGGGVWLKGRGMYASIHQGGSEALAQSPCQTIHV